MSEQFKMTPEEIKQAEDLYVNEGEFGSLSQVFNKFPRIYAFRPYRVGDEVVDTTCTAVVVNHCCNEESYFILRPRKKVTVIDYIFRATGETRVPEAGEWYRSPTFRPYEDAYLKAHPSESYTTAREIYTREAVTREIEVDG